jgi:rhamnose transport system permease protein
MIADGRLLKPQQIATTAFRLREIGVVFALLAAIVLFAVRADNFLTVGNWQNIGTDVAMVAVVAVGQTMVVLTRNIDLSVGSIVGLSAYVSAETLASHQGTPLVLIALLAMGVGLACGIGNGLLVAVGRIPAIIATLATLAIYRGLAFEATGGGGDNISAFQLPDNFLDLAARKPLGIPILAWLALVVALLGAAILRWAPWGRDFYAIGSNPEAARLAGIRVGRRVIAAFAICGALSGLGGFMFAARFASVDAIAGRGFELDVFTAVVIGGVNVFGGVGTVLGAVLGAAIIGVLENGMVLLGVNTYAQQAVTGAVILLAVGIDIWQKRRRQRAV